MKKKLITLLFLLVCISTSFSQQVRTDHLYSLITDIRNAMPGNGSNGYIVPTIAQQDSFALIIDEILAANYSLADSLARYQDYRLYEWYDTGSSNHLYYVLMEHGADNQGDVDLGWGTYIFDPTGYQEVIIEVPHPLWDSNTWKVGFKGYQNTNTRYFLMAGAHRYANGNNPAPADVAHNTQNMFHVVHKKVSPFSTHSLQVHGFNKNNPNYAGYPDVVISNGSSNPTQILDSLSNAITPFGYSVGIFNGTNYVYLGATTNTQGQWSRSQGYSFAHMELEYFIRASNSEWENIVDALHIVFLQPFLSITNLNQKNPKKIILNQNYPNPFNSDTNIEYYINKSQKIELIIYNVKGKTIKTLVSENTQAGHHKLRWNGRDNYNNPVASGLYFYCLKSADFSISRKLLLIE